MNWDKKKKRIKYSSFHSRMKQIVNDKSRIEFIVWKDHRNSRDYDLQNERIQIVERSSRRV